MARSSTRRSAGKAVSSRHSQVQPAGGLRLGGQVFQQIGAGHDAHDLPGLRVHHRDLAPAGLGHQALDVLDRIIGSDGMAAGFHNARDRI